MASAAGNEITPRIVARADAAQEVVYSLDNDVLGQAIDSGALSGVPYGISQVSTSRETTPVIACTTATSCIVPYRWLDTTETYNIVNRIKARILSYP